MKDYEIDLLLENLASEFGVPKPKWRIASKSPRTFYVKKETESTKLGGRITITTTCKAKGTVKAADESNAWMEFYGRPSRSTVIHEFIHYLEFHKIPEEREKAVESTKNWGKIDKRFGR